MSGWKEIMDETTHPTIYKKAYWRYLCDKHGYCVLCWPHRGCNSERIRCKYRSWKRYRKTQYKNKEII